MAARRCLPRSGIGADVEDNELIVGPSTDPGHRPAMTLKKTDLARQLELKIEAQRKLSGAPGRFGQATAALPDRKAQRRADSAAGLVPFACKLPAPLAAQLRERAAGHEGGLNALVTELLTRALA